MAVQKDYKAIAEIINSPEIDASDYHDGCMGSDKILFADRLAIALANYFASKNKWFNRDTFIRACGITN